jgi:GR25 family glycosyltransferase involved in LPS biosynthesis
MLSKKFKYSYLINLKRREDRFENFQKNFEYANEVLRFDAVDARQFDYGDSLIIDNLKKAPFKIDKVIIPGIFACNLSHYKVWETIANNENINDEELCMIFEDDVMFHSFFNEIFNVDYSGVDFIYFGGQNHINIDKAILENYWEVSKQSKYLFERKLFDLKVIEIFDTTEAYAINKRTAKIFIKKFRTELLFKHIDHILEDIKNKKTSDIADKIKMFNYFPNVCYQASELGTDIWSVGLNKNQLFLQKLRKSVPLPPIKTVQTYFKHILGYLKYKFNLQKR